MRLIFCDKRSMRAARGGLRIRAAAISCCTALACGFAMQLSASRVHAQAQPQVRLEMSADKRELAMTDNVSVRIYVQTQGSGQPDIEVPEFEGFQVVQRAVQRPMQFSFGFGQAAPVVTSTTQYTFVLVPMGAGTFKIPPVRVTFGQRVYQSQPLVLTVSGQASQPNQPLNQNAPQASTAPDQQQPSAAAPAVQSGGDTAVFDQEAFLRTVIDKTEPYEGEQVTATVYLYVRHNLQQVPAVQTEASTDGFWVQDLLSATRALEPTRQIVNGHGFWVYVLRRFAGFPLRTGDLTIGSMTLTISRDSVFDLFDPGHGPADLQRSSVPVQLHVKALPAEHRPDGPIAVGKFEIKSEIDRAQVATGDAVTWTASVRGTGNLRTVKLNDPSVPGLQILQPEMRDLVESPNDRVQGSRTFAWLVVPQAPGKISLPALSLNTFDPETHSYKRVASERLTLTAAGAARAAVAQPSKPNAGPGVSNDHEENWPAVRAHSELDRAHKSLASHGLYALAISIWPLLWLGSVLVPVAMSRWRARGGESRERAALQTSKQRLNEAARALEQGDARTFHALVAAALMISVEAKLGEPVSGLTQSELRNALSTCGLPNPLVQGLCEALAQCDFARFSSANVSPADMQSLLARATHLRADLMSFETSSRNSSEAA
jgi:hypothetical protein